MWLPVTKPFRDSHYSDLQDLHLWSGLWGPRHSGLILDFFDTYSHYSNHLRVSIHELPTLCGPKMFLPGYLPG